MKRISKSAKGADKEILILHTGRTQNWRSSLIVCAGKAGMFVSLKKIFKLLINAFSILRKAFKIEKDGV